jgi:uncharacterized delta-60 repeat protein
MSFITRHPSASVRLLALTATLFVAGAITWVLAGAGNLDPTFGTGGVVRTDVTATAPGCCEGANAIAVQPDGKILVSGGILTAFQTFVDNDFLLLRYNVDGSLDPTFGDLGIKIASVGALTNDRAADMILQPDGRIVVVGATWAGPGTPTQVAVLRFLPNGDLDSTFDTDGIATFRFGNFNDEVTSVALQTDGRIVVAGAARDERGIQDFAVARLNANGTLDNSFGTLGRVVTPVSIAPTSSFLDEDYANAVVVQPDGAIVAAGGAWDVDGFGSFVTQMAVVRYTPLGALDSTFDSDGKKVFTFGSDYGYSDQIEALALQPDGKIVGAGLARKTTGGLRNEFAVLRLEPGGSFDSSFGGTGRVTTRMDPLDAAGNSITIQPDGRIVVAGLRGNDYAIARYQSGGALDSSFGAGVGFIVTDLGGYDSAFAVTYQADGKLLIAGNTLPLTPGPNQSEVLVARYDGGAGATAQAITFDPLPNMLFGDPPFTVSASATSALPVRFTATGTCTVSGAIVTLTSIGTCSVTASQDGDATFAAAADVTRSFQVLGARTLTVSKSGSGTGTVTSAPAGIDCGVDCSTTYQDGAVVALTATPDAGSFFAGWSGDADCSDGQLTMNVDVSCVATFTSQRFIAELVAEIRPGTSGSLPSDMAVFNGSLYFAANDGVNGRELWRLDAGAAAPVMAANIALGPDSSSPSQLTVAGGVLYFRATTSSGFELWKYDGVSAALAADINPGAGGSFLSSLTAFGDEVVFRATDGTDGEELFAYSPAAGLKPLNVNKECAGCGSNPYGLMVYEGRLYFGAAESSLIGEELHSYNGTTVTRLTEGLSPSGPIGVNGRLVYSSGLQITQLRSYEIATGDNVEIVLPGVNIFGPVAGGFTRMNDVVYFAAQDDLNGRELWVTDGTAAGTRLVADINPGLPGSDPRNLTPFNGELVFSAIDAAAGRELHATSGSAPRLIVDLAPGSASSEFDGLFVMSNLLFFGAGDGPTEQPWVTDGTPTGIEVIRKAGGQLINPSGGSIDGARFTPFNGAIYFAARSSDFNTELWKISLGGGGGNQPPVAVATAPDTVAAGASCVANVTLDGSGSSDPDGDALTYTWTENGTTIGTGASPTVPLSAGTHTLRLTVTDPLGASSFDEVTVVVTSTTTLTYLGPALLQASGPNLVRVSVAQAGNPVSGAAVVITVNGTPYQATTTVAGEASVDVGAVAGATATITIDYATAAACGATLTVTPPVNAWPVAVGSASTPNVAGAACAAQVTFNATGSQDPDGDTLTFAWSEGATLLANGSPAAATLGAGTHQITLTVTDGRGGSGSTTFPVVVRPQPSAIQYTGPTNFVIGVATSVSATLKTNAGTPIVGAAVRFMLDGSSSTGTTDANGLATASVTASPAGAHIVSATFDGDPCHETVGVNVQATVQSPTGTIIVTTIVNNDSGGTLTASDFSYTVVASSPNPSTFTGSATGVSVTVNAGGYLINQSPRVGYLSTPDAGCSGTIASGETKNCTITNDDQLTTLTLVKQVVNDSGGTLQASAWTLRANATAFTQGQATSVAPGEYVLDEIGPAGYTASGWNCIGGSHTGATLTIAPNTQVICTIANDDQPATLKLTKSVTNDNGGTRSVSDFQLTAGALQFVSGVGQVVPAGTYTLGESGPGGYAPSAWSCTGSGTLTGSVLTLAPGQAAECSITNDDIAPGNATFTRLGPGTGYAGPTTLTATLRDTVTGQPLAGRTVIFTLGSQTTAAPTDFDGVAKASLNVAQAPGQLTLTSRFAGDTVYAPAQAARLFEIVFDTDRDGLPDSWEINGVDLTGDGTIDLPLPAMGANPLRKDIFVEVDWMVKPDPCVWLVCWSNGGVLRPQRAVLDTIVARFAAAPVNNPDGSTGISLHVDGGPDTIMNPLTGEPWGPLSRAGVVPYDASLGATTAIGEYDWSEFDALKQVFLEPGRRPVFHYAIYADTLAQDNYAGISRDFIAADFIVAAGDSSWNGGMTATQEASVFVHELGHNLGLRHGGGDNFNYKPNYFSAMNYLWSLKGLPPDSRPDYSLGVEAAIDETVAGDVNGDGRLSTLVDFMDWQNLVFTGGGIGGLNAQPEPMTTPLDPIDPVEMRERGLYARDGDGLLNFRGPSLLVLDSGAQSLRIDVKNISDVDAAYVVSAESALFAGSLSAGASVAAGSVAQVTLPVDTTGLVPGEYLVTFTLRNEAGELLHRQQATIVVIDLSVPENQEAARAALAALEALPPDSGLDPLVVDQITAMVEEVLPSWTAEVRVSGRVTFDAAYAIEDPVIPKSPGRFTVRSLAGSPVCVLNVVRAGKAASGTVQLQRPSGAIFEAPIAGKWDEATRTFDGSWLDGKARGGSISFRLREP